ncbi:MAG: tetraacyldisaccharide 4'-kinase [Burkholderiaceae bacterium]|nr:tetraacyldisaccharide 4'-kinase [Burkholderiaceae bacterium]
MGERWASRIQQAWQDGDALAQALRPLGALHDGLQGLRAMLYQCGVLRAGQLPVPVVVVGNWIVGGAGKTPSTLALLRVCKQMGLSAGVISRGYGRSDKYAQRLVSADDAAADVGDEPLLIHLRAQVPVAVGADRIAAARTLLAAHPEVQLLVSDDGLQHWRLPRQLSVLVFDERGLGNGRLLPAGPLRQNRSWPAAPGSTARQLVLYNCDRPSTALPGFIAERRLGGAAELSAWWRGEAAQGQQLDAFSGPRHGQAPLWAAAGMAQPERFFGMLRVKGLGFWPCPLPDHFDFAAAPWPDEPLDVLVTEKDAVKLRPERFKQARIWVVTLDFQPEQAFEQALHDELQALLT